jgi:hypothetical protein
MKAILLLFLAGAAFAAAATSTTVLQNERVIGHEVALRAGETEPAAAPRPTVTVFLADGTGERMGRDGKIESVTAKRGEVMYRAAHEGMIRPQGRLCRG